MYSYDQMINMIYKIRNIYTNVSYDEAGYLILRSHRASSAATVTNTNQEQPDVKHRDEFQNTVFLLLVFSTLDFKYKCRSR